MISKCNIISSLVLSIITQFITLRTGSSHEISKTLAIDDRILLASLSIHILKKEVTAPLISGLDYVWSGAIKDTSVTVIVKTKSASSDVICIVSANIDLSSPVYISTSKTTDANNIVRFDEISGLKANTQYYYGIIVDGELDIELNDADNGSGNYTGKFKTFPSPGTACNFNFTSGTGHHGSLVSSTHEIYTKTKEENPLFHVLTGDFYYCDQNHNGDTLSLNNNITENNVRYNYLWPLTSNNQSNLYRSSPVVYIWDDHDFGRNDRVGSQEPIAMPNVHNVYRQLAPHYSLKGSGTTPIFQTWTVGRVKFIMTDLYTDADVDTKLDDENKTRLGATQKMWFKEELLKANGEYPLIIWISSFPWIGAEVNNENRWQSYSTERTEIADFVNNNNIQGVSIISGDMHGSAIDDGTNSDYATGGGAPINVFQTGPYGRPDSYKGGPFSHGSTTDNGGSLYIYGLVEIIDDTDSITTSWQARNINGIQVAEQDDYDGDGEIKYSFTHSSPVLSVLNPSDNSTDVNVSGNLSITFSENIYIDMGNIYIKQVSDNSIFRTIAISSCSISTNQLTIPYTGLSLATEYYVEIEKTTIKDSYDNYFSGIYNPPEISLKNGTLLLWQS